MHSHGRRLGISNLAWAPSQDREVAAQLRAFGISNVEIAPTMYWPDIHAASQENVVQVRQLWESAGIQVCALQSIFFGRPDLQLLGPFHDPGSYLEHFKKFLSIASWFGAKVIVFGGPKNRLKGSLSTPQAIAAATGIFRELGTFAHDHDVIIGIEANATAYGCDFLINTAEAKTFVDEVGSAGVRLHLDLGNMILAGESPDVTITSYANEACHFHLSAPHLKAPTPTAELWRHLETSGFNGIVSIEMLNPDRSLVFLEDVIASAARSMNAP